MLQKGMVCYTFRTESSVKLLKHVSPEQANLLQNIISHSIFKYDSHTRIIIKQPLL